MDVSTQILIETKQSTNLELNEHLLGGNECEELTHSQQQPQAPKTQKGVKSQVDYQNHNALAPPPKVSPLQA